MKEGHIDLKDSGALVRVYSAHGDYPRRPSRHAPPSEAVCRADDRLLQGGGELARLAGFDPGPDA